MAIRHHYEVSNDFYRHLLGPSTMTYSCGRYVSPDATLEQVQSAKHELICRKLGLDELLSHTGRGVRLLDVGCGWGKMVIHAATNYDVEAVGITISEQQALRARKRVAEAGVADRVEIRLQDYCDIDDGWYDAISSIGMAEHVGKARMNQYFATLYRQLRPGGRMLTTRSPRFGGSRMARSSFIGRYAFPDGELLDLSDTVSAIEAAGFEIRDVENLRKRYARAITAWAENLEQHWDEAVVEVGEGRARVWRLYLAGSINGFKDWWASSCNRPSVSRQRPTV